MKRIILLAIWTILLAGCTVKQEWFSVTDQKIDNIANRIEDIARQLDDIHNNNCDDYVYPDENTDPSTAFTKPEVEDSPEIQPLTYPYHIWQVIRCPQTPVTEQWDGKIIKVDGEFVVIAGTYWHMDYLPYDIADCPSQESIPYACTKSYIQKWTYRMTANDCFIPDKSNDQ
jgi:hypothetical protein